MGFRSIYNIRIYIRLHRTKHAWNVHFHENNGDLFPFSHVCVVCIENWTILIHTIEVYLFFLLPASVFSIYCLYYIGLFVCLFVCLWVDFFMEEWVVPVETAPSNVCVCCFENVERKKKEKKIWASINCNWVKIPHPI